MLVLRTHAAGAAGAVGASLAGAAPPWPARRLPGQRLPGRHGAFLAGAPSRARGSFAGRPCRPPSCHLLPRGPCLPPPAAPNSLSRLALSCTPCHPRIDAQASTPSALPRLASSRGTPATLRPAPPRPAHTAPLGWSPARWPPSPCPPSARASCTPPRSAAACRARRRTRGLPGRRGLRWPGTPAGTAGCRRGGKGGRARRPGCAPTRACSFVRAREEEGVCVGVTVVVYVRLCMRERTGAAAGAQICDPSLPSCPPPRPPRPPHRSRWKSVVISPPTQ